MYQLIATKACGSMITEMMLALAKLPHEIDEVVYDKPSEGRDRLLARNPLGQVPTLILPDGRVMTESAAITLHINDVAPEAGLLPPLEDPKRPEAFRWLIFLVSAIYPTFTYGDEPAKWLDGDAEAGKRLRKSTDEHRKAQWLRLEAIVEASPWFLGARFSALDIYIAVMTNWRPGKKWFEASCPKLSAIARAARAMPIFEPVFARNE